MAVACNSFLLVALCVGPNLDSAKLRNAVFDVIERNLKEVENATPACAKFNFKATPIQTGTEALIEFGVLGIQIGGIAGSIGILVNPVLEGIASRNACQQEQ